MTPLSMPLVAGWPWPLLALVAPLALGLLACVPRMRRHALWLLPLAPLPALPVAVLGPQHGVTRVSDLLLGVQLAVDDHNRLFLLLAAWLWFLAGVHAVSALRGTRRPAVFAAFWCLTLAGNLGVFMAQDVATFYVAFAAVSLAAYVLVVHDATDRALRAGRVYLTLAVLGEAALLGGLLIGVHAADSMLIADVRLALGQAPLRHAAIALLVVGFGLKAGLMPLHPWLPLAHPAAPTPASAVLSGAIVKAGIWGLIAFLPGAMQAVDAGQALLVLGFVSAYAGVLLGLTQHDLKAVLAYSTISQMGLVIAVIGWGLTQPGSAAALAAATVASVHHGLAKGALFLSVAVLPACRPGLRPWALALAALVALSVAGLPLTGGAWAKAALKGPLQGGWAEWALTLSAIGTTLLLLRFWLLLRAKAVKAAESAGHAAGAGAGLPWAQGLPWVVLAASAVLLPWVLPGHTSLGPGIGPGTGHPIASAASATDLWAGTWPLLLAAAIAAVAVSARLRPPAVPEGDIAVPLERAVQASLQALQRAQAWAVVRAAAGAATALAMAGRPLQRAALRRWWLRASDWRLVERWLSRGSVAGSVLLVLVLAIAALVRAGGR